MTRKSPHTELSYGAVIQPHDEDLKRKNTHGINTRGSKGGMRDEARNNLHFRFRTVRWCVRRHHPLKIQCRFPLICPVQCFDRSQKKNPPNGREGHTGNV